jgi:hypothetical protein
VGSRGIEPRTSSLSEKRSTDELAAQKAALRPLFDSQDVAGSVCFVRLTAEREKPGVRPVPILLRKEVIHPHLPVRIPCYDLALITSLALGPQGGTSGAADFLYLTGSVYKI